MTADTRLQPIKQLYEESLASHGTTSAGVGWPDPNAHLIRFQKLAELIDTHSPVSVNDLGCGYGAFFRYLRERGTNVNHFRGYDISGEMIERAKSMEPAGQFYVSDKISHAADYSFACGIFNVRLERTEQDWREHIVATLDNMARFSTRGFAFNVLSGYVDFRRDHLYYADPAAFFDLCKTRYSKKVALLHDYPLYEWTLLVRL